MTEPPNDKRRAAFYARQMRKYRAHNGGPTPVAERVRILQCFGAPVDKLAGRICGYVYFTDHGRTCRTPLNRFIRAV